MSRFIKIGEAASLLGITVQTLRRWEQTGHLKPDRKSDGGTFLLCQGGDISTLL